MEKAQARRESVEIPKSAADLVDFFLVTDTNDMEYFVSKCRPLLTSDFFTILDNRIGQLRFLSGDDNQDGLEELEGLRDYVKQFIAAQVCCSFASRNNSIDHLSGGVFVLPGVMPGNPKRNLCLLCKTLLCRIKVSEKYSI